MQHHERISSAIRAADGRALIPFVTAGYPRADDFVDTLVTLAEHAAVIEIGVPFSDPMADGMTIQRSSHQAIANGVSLRWILEQLTIHETRIDVPLVLMSYLNPMLAYGLDALAQAASAAGVCGFIVPDLPFEESAPVRHALEAAGLGLIQLVTPATPAARLQQLAEHSKGFVYAVTVNGITGGAKGMPAHTGDYLTRVKAASSLPVCAGFGIRTGADVSSMCQHVDGAIVGSALVEVLERGDSAAAFMASLASE
ncbi:MAG: tryptophan synthase subunit alpha [Pseudomonadota bacterium]